MATIHPLLATLCMVLGLQQSGQSVLPSCVYDHMLISGTVEHGQQVPAMSDDGSISAPPCDVLAFLSQGFVWTRLHPTDCIWDHKLSLVHEQCYHLVLGVTRHGSQVMLSHFWAGNKLTRANCACVYTHHCCHLVCVSETASAILFCNHS